MADIRLYNMQSHVGGVIPEYWIVPYNSGATQTRLWFKCQVILIISGSHRTKMDYLIVFNVLSMFCIVYSEPLCFHGVLLNNKSTWTELKRECFGALTSTS